MGALHDLPYRPLLGRGAGVPIHSEGL